MSEKNEHYAIPPPLRESLLNEPADRRREIPKVWDLLGKCTPDDEPETSIDEAWNLLVIQLEAGQSGRSAGYDQSDRSGGSGHRKGNYPPAADLPTSKQILTNGRAADPRTSDRRRMRDRDTTKQRIAPRRGTSRRLRLRWAAVIAAAVVIFGVWFLRRPVTIAADPGAQQDVTLPDGSVVEMNSETELRYARFFGVPMLSSGDRRVLLNGEAYFTVAPDDGRFVVETPEARVEVLGTEFNVRSRPGPLDGGTQVTVASGSVRVEAKSRPGRPVVLSEPGASGTVTEAGRILVPDADQAASLDHVLAWRNRGFVAVDLPIDAILDEVERRYGLIIAPREGVDPTRLTSVFYLRGGTADQILSAICLNEACTYRETSRGFALSPQDSSL